MFGLTYLMVAMSSRASSCSLRAARSARTRTTYGWCVPVLMRQSVSTCSPRATAHVGRSPYTSPRPAPVCKARTRVCPCPRYARTWDSARPRHPADPGHPAPAPEVQQKDPICTVSELLRTCQQSVHSGGYSRTGRCSSRSRCAVTIGSAGAVMPLARAPSRRGDVPHRGYERCRLPT